MKTPEEIKKGLAYCANDSCCDCPYDIGLKCSDEVMLDALAYIKQLEDVIDKTTQLMQSATEVIKRNQEQLESTYSQVKKALCGKENVSWVEVLDAVHQLKSRLALVERERDAVMSKMIHECDNCKYGDCYSFETPCNTCNHLFRVTQKANENTDNWQFRGSCTENTKEDSK